MAPGRLRRLVCVGPRLPRPEDQRLALAATLAFYGMNGLRLTATNDQAYDLIVDVASGRVDDVEAIASVLK